MGRPARQCNRNRPAEDARRYPTSEERLKALIERPGTADRWRGPYLKSKDGLVDPWGEPYRYRIPGQRSEFDLYSLGADKAEDGDGENADVFNN